MRHQLAVFVNCTHSLIGLTSPSSLALTSSESHSTTSLSDAMHFWNPCPFSRTTECLGSGQFGTVNRGVWHGSGPPLDVAIKTLNSSANEVDRVKFLQEGAIMGQFRHPNVVKLHGIVREQQTVSFII